MERLLLIRFSILMLIQIILSFVLIYNKKNTLSYFTEIILSVLSFIYSYYIIPSLISNYNIEIIDKIYNGYVVTLDIIWLYIIEYIVFKIVLLLLIYLLKYFSFYALVSCTKKKGKIAKFFYIIFGKKRFLHFVSRMWNKVDYGIRIKKGIPGMVNKKHQSTGVYFDKDGFPKFKEITRVKLSRKYYLKSREVHFYQCNKITYQKIQKDKRFANKFSKADIEKFKLGQTPSKYTWHHNQNKGVLQLVDSKIHSEVSHRGGYSIWGKREK